MKNVFLQSPVYQNPPKSLHENRNRSLIESNSQKLIDSAASCGLKLEFNADRTLVAIINPAPAPDAWRVLAAPLTQAETWHWLNAYAAGRASVVLPES